MIARLKRIVKENYLLILGLVVASSLLVFSSNQLSQEGLRDRRLLDFESERRAVVLGRSLAVSLFKDLGNVSEIQKEIDQLKKELIEIREIDVLTPQDDKFKVIASTDRKKVATVAVSEVERQVYDSGQEYAEWVEIEVKHGLKQPVQEKKNLLELTLPIKNYFSSQQAVGLLFLSYSTKASENLYIANQQESYVAFLATAAFVFLFIFSFSSIASKLYRRVLLLKESVKSKDELLSMAAHELGTPLAHVKGSLSVIISGLGDKLPKKEATLLRRSFDSTQRLIDLVEDILTVSRFERGKLEIFPRPVHIEEILQSVIKSYKSLAEQRGLKLRFLKPKESLPKLVIDPDKLSEIVGNLLSNAVKYTAAGKIQLKVLKQGIWVVLEVSDTGIGIAKEDLPKLFERFSRIRRSAGRVKGTGLGLYITKLLVEAHGGRIEAESELKKGTTFRIYFPT